jgi:acetolactate synthase-1/2/3 large subunit
MNGAESLVKTFLASGVDVCFANPGTSEMHFVAALDSHPDMRCVLCLFEGGCSGAAEGYWRMSEKVASTMFHLAPGFGNAYSNLHNARKGGAGIVNVMGDHATHHLKHESPLKGDTVGISQSVSHWTRVASDACDVAMDGAAAIRAARSKNGQIATLILPADTAWSDATKVVTAVAPPALRRPDDAMLDTAAKLLRQPGAVLSVDGTALYGPLRELAGQIAEATGARLMAPMMVPRIERGAGTTALQQQLYVVDQNVELLKDTSVMVLCGSNAPVCFFAYPGKPSVPTPPDCLIHPLCDPTMDIEYSLTSLADRVGALGMKAENRVALNVPDLPHGQLTVETMAQAIGALMPEDAIVVNESITAGFPIGMATAQTRPHETLITTGGAIGAGLPTAVGAAVAQPDRKVLALTGDGSAMYTLQSLWTMARERLDVTVVVVSNRVYQILHGELAALGVNEVGRNARRMFDLDDPGLNWVALAEGHGVEGHRADTAEGFVKALQHGLATKGPVLIEAIV